MEGASGDGAVGDGGGHPIDRLLARVTEALSVALGKVVEEREETESGKLATNVARLASASVQVGRILRPPLATAPPDATGLLDEILDEFDDGVVSRQ